MKEYIVRNAEIRENGCGGYLVVGDTERFGEQEILFESPFKEECRQFMKEHSEKTTEEEVEEVLKNLPEEKKNVLVKALERNMNLTSSYVLESLEIVVYEEGKYFMFEGTRCGFNVFVNREGKVIRKPLEKKLNRVGRESMNMCESTFLTIF